MTEERSIPDCIEVIQGVLGEIYKESCIVVLREFEEDMEPRLKEALQCLEAVERHCETLTIEQKCKKLFPSSINPDPPDGWNDC